MKIDIDGNDLVAAVAAQRNDAMDDAANNAATIQALLRQIAARDAQIAELKQKLTNGTGTDQHAEEAHQG